ncbi:unnamed protein product, partial [Staurois parvus]
NPSLAVFLRVARGKVSAPQALHSGIHCSVAPGSLLHLPCPALPRCPSCSVPGNVLRRMPASVFWVLLPATSGRTGDGTGGKFENVKSDIHS